MYNYSKLLGALKEKGLSQEILARRIGISPYSLNRKLKNNSQFKQSEIELIIKTIGKVADDIPMYFFTH